MPTYEDLLEALRLCNVEMKAVVSQQAISNPLFYETIKDVDQLLDQHRDRQEFVERVYGTTNNVELAST